VYRHAVRVAARGCAAFAVVLALAGPPPAFADGDPPSDVLVAQDVYYGFGLNTEDKRAAQLPVMLAKARERGFELKVALIANYSDLGLVGNFWLKPDEYVRYLGEELSLVYHGRLLVVMRNGYALYHDGKVPGGARRILRRLERPGPVTGFFPRTIRAVRALAAAEGVKLTLPDVTAPDGGMTNAQPQQHSVPPQAAGTASPERRQAAVGPPATGGSSTGAWLFLVPVAFFVAAAAVAIGVSRRRNAV
jgi:hypothetical protein